MPSHPKPAPAAHAGRAISIPDAHDGPPPIDCPFVLIQDSREQTPHRFASLFDDADDVDAGFLREPDPFTFDGVQANADKKYAKLIVKVVRTGIPRGDYQILGLPGVTVERKSPEDLYASIGRRENFISRLKAMSEHEQRAHVVVEAPLEQLAAAPPSRHTRMSPKAIMRTIQAWSNDYPAVHWWFMPGKDWAEVWTFRLLEDWYRKRKLDMRDVTVLDQATGKMVRSIPGPLDEIVAPAKPSRGRKPGKASPGTPAP